MAGLLRAEALDLGLALAAGNVGMRPLSGSSLISPLPALITDLPLRIMLQEPSGEADGEAMGRDGTLPSTLKTKCGSVCAEASERGEREPSRRPPKDCRERTLAAPAACCSAPNISMTRLSARERASGGGVLAVFRRLTRGGVEGESGSPTLFFRTARLLLARSVGSERSLSLGELLGGGRGSRSMDTPETTRSVPPGVLAERPRVSSASMRDRSRSSSTWRRRAFSRLSALMRFSRSSSSLCSRVSAQSSSACRSCRWSVALASSAWSLASGSAGVLLRPMSRALAVPDRAASLRAEPRAVAGVPCRESDSLARPPRPRPSAASRARCGM
mmetsp:Transcript_89821/g.231930  ORF Transcript_89821/g.231930 Transcript_89821/m.231930 type:complete len:331 (+) Transcript_89821:594-1586(+)